MIRFVWKLILEPWSRIYTGYPICLATLCHSVRVETGTWVVVPDMHGILLTNRIELSPLFDHIMLYKPFALWYIMHNMYHMIHFIFGIPYYLITLHYIYHIYLNSCYILCTTFIRIHFLYCFLLVYPIYILIELHKLGFVFLFGSNPENYHTPALLTEIVVAKVEDQSFENPHFQE